jgi:transcriptional regulator with XRE-family HTH domain
VEFGKWLQGVRQKQGHSSQKEFAKLLDITDVQLSRIETGASGISSPTLNTIIDLLNLDPMEAYNKAGLLPESIRQQAMNDSRQAEDSAERAAQAERMGELVKGFGLLSPKEQQQILAIIRILKSDHPELLHAPIEIADAKDLTDDDAEIVTDDTPP